MRIIYPKKIRDEIDYIKQFLVFNGKEYVVRDDAPEDVKERREAVRNWERSIREDFMAWDVESDENDNLRIIKPSGEIITARRVTDEELYGKRKRKKKKH